MSALDALQALERQQPEWRPWLTLIREVVVENDDGSWEAAVPASIAGATADAPLLGSAIIRVNPDAIARLLDKPRRRGAREAFGSARLVADGAQLLSLFDSALNGDDARLRGLACELRADADAFTAAAALVPLPFLHACAKRWMGEVPEGWSAGYCPICAAWPALAEVRGVERMRYLRCGRCGSAWRTSTLWCAYCGTDDHEAFESLIVEQSVPPATIEACTRCRGYVKAFSTLTGCPPGEVMLEDLASAALDFHAVRRGYHRRGGLGRPLCAIVVR